MLAAVEGGGTKFLCAVGTGPHHVVDRIRIDTSTPDETLGRVVDFLRPHAPERIGVAMFGPLELRTTGPRRGATLITPKAGWSSVPVRERLAEALGADVAIDTDVNAAALAEARWGAAQGADPVVYVTVGTGVGGGAVVHGRPLHGLMHPEMGHVPVPRLALADGTPDPFPGACPFHGRCLEGVASGSALQARRGGEGGAHPDGDPVWDLTAAYLAHGLAAVTLILSPERLVLGGGVMAQPGLHGRVRHHLAAVLAGYVPRPEVGEDMDQWLLPPALPDPGLAGAFALAGA
jgi:fructokinase